jgi:hypothetical protein
MSTKAQKRGSAITSLPTPSDQPKVIEATSKRKKGDPDEPVRQTFFLPRPVHRRLREICLDKGISQQDIFRAALDMYLTREGEPTMEEIEAKAKR